MEGRTVIVIAHRLTTAERADRVAVCDDGRYAALYAAWVGEHANAQAAQNGGELSHRG